MNPTDAPTPITSNDGDGWMPVAVAAARLGVSERTVQRRAEKKKIESKEVTDEQGKRLLIRLDLPTGESAEVTTGVPTSADNLARPADRVPTSNDNLATGDDTKTDLTTPNDKVPTPPADTLTTLAPTSDDKVPTSADNLPTPADTSNAAFLAHVLEENRFLRSALEQRDRDAAELRAALREALKISARQLPEGAPQSSPTPQERAPVPPDEPQIGQGSVPPSSPPMSSPPTLDNDQHAKPKNPQRGDALAKIREALVGLFPRRANR